MFFFIFFILASQLNSDLLKSDPDLSNDIHMFFQGVPRCMISEASTIKKKQQPRVDPRKHARKGDQRAASC